MDTVNLLYVETAINHTLSTDLRYQIGKEFFPCVFDNLTLRHVVEMFLGPLVYVQVWRGTRHGKLCLENYNLIFFAQRN